MGTLIGRRLLALIPILLLVSFATFMLVALFPGDAAVTIAGGQNATAARVVEVRHELHLDDPMLEQYGRWLGGAVHLDLGNCCADGKVEKRPAFALFAVVMDFRRPIIAGGRETDAMQVSGRDDFGKCETLRGIAGNKSTIAIKGDFFRRN